ncbi:MAG: GrpB family protein [Lachnospirales bacterium]
MIGLKRGTVQLYDHDPAWEEEARRTILQLRNILGGIITDIQHVGSTSIRSIKAKPIIDIMLAADRFEDILAFEEPLREAGFYYRPGNLPHQLLFACGNYYDGSGDLQTHFIHVVLTNSADHINYIYFRDYMNGTPSAAKEYERLKIALAQKASAEDGRKMYLAGKHDFIVRMLAKALAHSYLGKTVEIRIDRPLGSTHPSHPDLVYPINYGYIPGVISGDGEELDVYLLGVEEPVNTYLATIIAMIHRHNDTEDKLVAAPMGKHFTKEEIAQAVAFQEQYYESEVEI